MKEYKRPLIVHIIFGTVIFMLIDIFHAKKERILSHIGKYILLKELTKENPFKKFEIGIYKNGDKKVFIKTWQGRIRDIGYYSLINQYITHTILQNKLRKRNSKLQIPSLIDVVEGRNSFSIVFEYIVGQKIEKLPHSEQAEVLLTTIKEFKNISSHLTAYEKNQLSKRSNFFYILSLPLLVAMSCFCNLEEFPRIIKLFVQSIFSFPLLLKEKNTLALAHRDLTLENLLQTKKNIYLLDTERMVLTHRSYDMSYISVVPKLGDLQTYLSPYFKKYSRTFLRNYIYFHLMSDPSNPFEYKAYFKNILGKMTQPV